MFPGQRDSGHRWCRVSWALVSMDCTVSLSYSESLFSSWVLTRHGVHVEARGQRLEVNFPHLFFFVEEESLLSLVGHCILQASWPGELPANSPTSTSHLTVGVWGLRILPHPSFSVGSRGWAQVSKHIYVLSHPSCLSSDIWLQMQCGQSHVPVAFPATMDHMCNPNSSFHGVETRRFTQSDPFPKQQKKKDIKSREKKN